MRSSKNHVLVLGKESDDLHALESVLADLCCSVTIANSEDQAVFHVDQAPPCLVILAGNHQAWSSALVEKLRRNTNTSWATIVVLTDFHSPSWLHHDEYPGFDGFLVKPVANDILTSLVQSAQARQVCQKLRSAVSCS